jgi:hypothetical protein
MQRAIFLDIDGKLTETLTGATFKQNPKDTILVWTQISNYRGNVKYFISHKRRLKRRLTN